MSDENKLYDVILAPADRSRQIPPQMARAIVNYLAASGIASPTDEAVAETWVEVYCKPGPYAHLAFVKGGYTDEAPVFLEAVLRFGTRAFDVPHDPTGRSAFLGLEFLGSRYPEPTGEIRIKLAELFSLHLDSFSREHAGLPAHREVPEDELPKAKPTRKGRSPGGVGVGVEEL
jgi:hypothetical protein